MRGEFDEDNSFLYEYHFPYVRGTHISSNEDVTIERHAEKESYAGVCDDIKVGVSLIFYLQNMIPYKRLQALNQLPVQGTSLILSALSVSGMIMMPIIFGVFSFFYSAAFSVYMIVNTLYGLISTLIINKIVAIRFEKKDNGGSGYSGRPSNKAKRLK